MYATVIRFWELIVQKKEMEEQKFWVLHSKCSTIIHFCGLDVQEEEKKKVKKIKISSPAS